MTHRFILSWRVKSGAMQFVRKNVAARFGYLSIYLSTGYYPEFEVVSQWLSACMTLHRFVNWLVTVPRFKANNLPVHSVFVCALSTVFPSQPRAWRVQAGSALILFFDGGTRRQRSEVTCRGQLAVGGCVSTERLNLGATSQKTFYNNSDITLEV